MDNLSDQMGILSDEFIEECSEDSDDHGHSKNAPLREQDRFLPIANIAKIMKRAIPENGKIAKEARECIQECVSEFISFITSEASERCQNEKRKTINGEDILYAMCALGFDNYVDPLTLYLHKYRETTKTDRNISSSADSTFDESTTSTTSNTNTIASNFSQRNGTIGAGTSNTNTNTTTIINTNGTIAGPNASTASGGGGGTGSSVVLGQIGEFEIRYYDSQNQTFQL